MAVTLQFVLVLNSLNPSFIWSLVGKYSSIVDGVAGRPAAVVDVSGPPGAGVGAAVVDVPGPACPDFAGVDVPASDSPVAADCGTATPVVC